MPLRRLRPDLTGTVTSTSDAAVGRMFQCAAALAWDRTAPSPQARTAASQYASAFSESCPTE